MPIYLNDTSGVLVPPVSNGIDLVSYAAVVDALAASLPTDLTFLPSAITSASRQIRAYCKRDFVQQNYIETYNSQGFSNLFLKQRPVNQVTRVAVTPTTLLTVTNTDATTNQDAAVYFTLSGDYGSGQTTTGLTLVRTASAVTTVDATSITWTLYPTLNAVAAAINALGYGWSAQVAGGYGLWPSSYFIPGQGAQSCLSGGAATLQAHATRVSGWTYYGATAEVRFNTQLFDPVFAIFGGYSGVAQTVFPNGWQSIRVEYNAGYATVPEDVQQSAILTVQAWMAQCQVDRRYDSETQGKWTYKLSEAMKQGIPDAAKAILNQGGHRSFRSY